MKKEKSIVFLIVIMLIIVAIVFCYWVHQNFLKPHKIDISDFEIVENQEIAKINNVSNKEQFVCIEGEFMGEIKKYRIYIGIENSKGEIKAYRTQMKSEDQYYQLIEEEQLQKDKNKFYTLIKAEKCAKEDKINIIYMCDDYKTLIKTNRMVGEAISE